jgi:hypothetical protein
VKLYQAVNRVPAGWMAGSMARLFFLGMRIRTFAGNALKIGAFTLAIPNRGCATGPYVAQSTGTGSFPTLRVPLGTRLALTPLMTIRFGRRSERSCRLASR